MRLQGRVALITGTASGIGRAAALRFAAEGARIVAADIAEANAETAELVKGLGGEAIAVHADVTNETDVAGAVEVAEAEFGRLDVAFNNAGIMCDGDGDAMSTTEAVIDRLHRVQGGRTLIDPRTGRASRSREHSCERAFARTAANRTVDASPRHRQ